MAVAIAMPKLGMTMAEGTVVAWQTRVGENIGKGRALLLIESEKAEIEIESPIDGILRHVYVEAGAVVPCGTLLAALTVTADEIFDADAFRNAHTSPGRETSGSARPSAASSAPGSRAVDAAARRVGEFGVATAQAPVTPAARRRAQDLGIDATKAIGSGPGGRITVDDVVAYAERVAARIEVEIGVCLDVPASGAGDPLVLLPGFGTDVTAFAPQIPELAKRWRVLAVNPRGVGLSDGPDAERYDIARAAEDVAAVVASKKPAHVIGASMGAAIAIELALTHPESVRSLVLITPFVRASGRLAALTHAWISAAAAGRDVVGASLVPWMFSEQFLADGARRERAASSIAQTSGRIDHRVLARWADGIRTWSDSRTSALASITAPTLIIAASDDLLTPDSAEIATKIPGAKLLLIANAGHAVAIEKPAEVTRAIFDHLS